MSDFAIAETMLKLNKKPKYVEKKKRGQYNISVKKLLKSKSIKKIKAGQLEEAVYDAMPQIEKEVNRYVMNKHSIFGERNSKSREKNFTKVFTNKKFAKAICKSMKESNEFSEIVFYAVSGLYINKNEDFINNEKLVVTYTKLFKKFNDKKIVKLAKILGIEKDEALNIAFACEGAKQVKGKFMTKRFIIFLNEIADVKDLNVKSFKKAVKLLFKNYYSSFILAAMGQAPNNSENFNTITEALLEMIDEMDKKDRQKLLKSYAEKRKHKPNIRRRVNITTLSESEYNNLFKTIDKLVDHGMSMKYFV